MFTRVPVTVVTGLPGSGKTQLLRYLVDEARDGSVAVIKDAPGDLVQALLVLAAGQQEVQRVLVELPGCVSPGPVVQSLFAHREVRERFALGGVVAVADAQRLPERLNESAPACEQVALADMIVINRTELVSEGDLEALEQRLKAMNGIARIERCTGKFVLPESLFGAGGSAATAAPEPMSRESHYLFEWAGLYVCGPGCYRLELETGPAPTLAVALLRVDEGDTDAIAAATERASYLFATAGPVDRASGQVVLSGSLYQRLVVSPGESTHFHVLLPIGGRYVLFTQHLPREFKLTLAGPELIEERYFAPSQAHADPVNCVRLTVREPLHAVKFQHWLERLLRGRGGGLIRMQGCLNLAGAQDRIAIGGMHESIDTRVLDPWGDRARTTQLVLIGRGLARRDLLWSLRACGA